MNEGEVVRALAALAQESRLRVFRLLVQRGPEGMPAGEIARTLELPPATLSFHLSQLAAAGMIESRRESRSIRYSMRTDGVRGLLDFLVEDCCGGRPELCRSPEAAKSKPPARAVDGAALDDAAAGDAAPCCSPPADAG